MHWSVCKEADKCQIKLYYALRSRESAAHQFADSVQHDVDEFLPDGVVTASVIVGRILFASDQLLGVKQLAVGPSTHLIYG